MRIFLKLLFVSVFAVMTWVTVTASLDRGVMEAGRELWNDKWFQATLCDAYFAFLTFYVWVAYKERSLISRVTWFFLIMILGNFAIASYVLIQLCRLKKEEPLENLLLRTPR